MSFPQTIMGKWGWEKVTTSSKKHKLGTIMQIADTEYRYCLAGGADTVAGKIYEARAIVADDNDDLTVATAATAGGTTIGVTFGSAVTKDEYADGFLYSNTGATSVLGWRYRVKGHPAGTSDVTITIDEEDGFVQAVATSTTKAGLIPNPYQSVVISATTGVGPIVGVAVSDITTAQYGWLQTKGPAVVLAQGDIDEGAGIMRSNATAGAVEQLAEGSAAIFASLGQNGRTETVDGEYHEVFLNII